MSVAPVASSSALHRLTDNVVPPHAPKCLNASIRRTKTSLERRQQRQRSDARTVTRILSGLTSIASHRGNALSNIGKHLFESLSRERDKKSETENVAEAEDDDDVITDIDKPSHSDDDINEGGDDDEDGEEEEEIVSDSSDEDNDDRYLDSVSFFTSRPGPSVTLAEYAERHSTPIYFCDGFVHVTKGTTDIVPEVLCATDSRSMHLLRDTQIKDCHLHGRQVIEVCRDQWDVLMRLQPHLGPIDIKYFIDSELSTNNRKRDQ